MTQESFQRASELLPLIAKAKANIIRWEEAYSYRGTGHVDCCSKSSSYSSASAIHVPFDVAKALSLDGFRKELKTLEDEFNSL